MRRAGRVVRFGALLLGAITAAVAHAAAGPATVELTVRNAGEVPLRCVLVLAHFVTKDLPPLPAGGSLAIVMERDAAAGTLSQPRGDGRVMMVENLLCGAAERWDATRGDVPLLALRGAAPARMATACRIDRRLVCTAPIALDAM